MNIKELLKNKISEYVPQNAQLEYDKIEVAGLSVLKLRDALFFLGSILEEDMDNNCYVASIMSGAANKNECVISIAIEGEEIHILGFAHEGLIKQHTFKKAVGKIRAELQKEGFIG